MIDCKDTGARNNLQTRIGAGAGTGAEEDEDEDDDEDDDDEDQGVVLSLSRCFFDFRS